MHSASLAPELSAILRIVSCWIIASSLRLFDDFDQTPALRLRQRTCLHDPHDVTLARLTFLVVRVVLLRPRDLLAVERMRNSALDANHDRLLHLVAQHGAYAHLAIAATAFVFHLSHCSAPAAAGSSSCVRCRGAAT